MARQAFGSYRNSFIVREALRVAPARLNAAAGVRAALATTLPLLLVPVLERPELTWSSLAGFAAVLADKGGAYRTRALTMLSVCAAGALAVVLGTLCAAHPVLSVLSVLVVVGLGGFVRLFGAEATGVGISTGMTLVMALTRPADDLRTALTQAGFFVAGGLWSCLISLVLWPLRMYRPARLAVVHGLGQLAALADSFVAASTDPDAQVQRRTHIARAREAIEQARAALGASRQGRPGPSRRGEQLVGLLEASDQLFAALVALEDGLALEPSAHLPEQRAWVDGMARRAGRQLREVALALDDERPLVLAPDEADECARLLAALEPHVHARTEHVPRILARAIERLSRVVELARAIDDPSVQPSAGPAVPTALSSRASVRSLMRDHLTLDSAMFRHALRMAISTAVVVLSSHALGLEHGYWATLTCLVILQPHGAATWAKAVQRVLGTIVGAGLAALVATYVHEPSLIVLFVFVFVGLGMALLPLNYGAFAVFLTPGFVLLAETHAGNVGLASARVVNTLFGAAVALLGSRLLFPLSERDQFRPLMARAIAQLAVLLDAAAERAPVPERLAEARRKLGMALLNAEASYQRLLTETSLGPSESQAILTLLLFAHRLASGLIALSVAEGTASHTRLVEQAASLHRALDDLRAVVAERRLPQVDESRLVPSEPGERVDRLFEQLSVLRTAALRWNGG